MAQLAIKGHPTRGAEVIALLEMLGGKNTTNLHGECDNMIYIINSSYYGEIIYMLHRIDGYVVFSLEEFEEKYPYKVGDKVQYKGSTSCGSMFEVEKMRWEEYTVKYTLCLFGCNNYKRSTLPAEYLQPYEEETMEEQKQIPPYMDYDIRTEENIEETIKIDIPKGYEFFGIDDDNKVVLTKKQPQYPKTYKECCEVLMGKTDFQDFGLVLTKFSTTLYEEDSISPEPPHITLINNFYKLLICRDAYWKIAGEEMGLGKPWKPDYTNDDVKFCICCCANLVVDGITYETNQVLTFPTKEMRAIFLENFKELIEQCNELL